MTRSRASGYNFFVAETAPGAQPSNPLRSQRSNGPINPTQIVNATFRMPVKEWHDR